MALSVEQYKKQQNSHIAEWEYEANIIEVLIDAELERSISESIVPNPINPNFVMRYKFSNKVSKEAKDILKTRYGRAGWFINESSDFKDAMLHGYLDFYTKKPAKW